MRESAQVIQQKMARKYAKKLKEPGNKVCKKASKALRKKECKKGRKQLGNKVG